MPHSFRRNQVSTVSQTRDYIGSAHIAAICGVDGAFGSPISALQELKFGESLFDQDDLPEHIELGNVLEPHILKHYAKMTGRKIVDTQLFVRHRDYPMLGATPDAVACDDDSNFRLVDAKATGDYAWPEIPPRYVVSSLWQIGIYRTARQWSHIDSCDLAVYHLPARKVQVYTIEHDPEWFDLFSKFASDWWMRHVEGDELPPIDGHPATSKFLRSIRATPGKTIELDAHEAAYDRYIRAQENFEVAEHERDHAKNELLALMGDAEIATIGGRKVFTWKEQSGRKTIDAAALKRDHPEIYETYTKQGKPFRVARFVG